jgi:hypothetical protein
LLLCKLTRICRYARAFFRSDTGNRGAQALSRCFGSWQRLTLQTSAIRTPPAEYRHGPMNPNAPRVAVSQRISARDSKISGGTLLRRSSFVRAVCAKPEVAIPFRTVPLTKWPGHFCLPISNVPLRRHLQPEMRLARHRPSQSRCCSNDSDGAPFQLFPSICSAGTETTNPRGRHSVPNRVSDQFHFLGIGGS